jgi:23S rRNA (adenine-N6)-dimethyltransferase
MSRPRPRQSPSAAPHTAAPHTAVPHPAAPRPVTPYGGRHELGQNLLLDKRFPASMAAILRHAPPRPILELGAGNGAVTEALLSLGRPVTAVELDPRAVTRLRRRFAGRVDVVEADLLTVDLPYPHDIVSNVPFGITTPLLRRLMPQQLWHTAVLLVQWEVARKRAGVGGTTMLTASWWPWYEFALAQRVPAAAFTPVPSVDGGILIIRRRTQLLLDPVDRRDYQTLVREVFTGRGRGLAEILSTRLPARIIDRWLRQDALSGHRLPRDLTADHWVSLYRVAREQLRR